MAVLSSICSLLGPIQILLRLWSIVSRSRFDFMPVLVEQIQCSGSPSFFRDESAQLAVAATGRPNNEFYDISMRESNYWNLQYGSHITLLIAHDNNSTVALVTLLLRFQWAFPRVHHSPAGQPIEWQVEQLNSTWKLLQTVFLEQGKKGVEMELNKILSWFNFFLLLLLLISRGGGETLPLADV